MTHYDHATELALKSLGHSKPRQLRTWELEQEAALERYISEHKKGKRHRPQASFRLVRLSALLIRRILKRSGRTYPLEVDNANSMPRNSARPFKRPIAG